MTAEISEYIRQHEAVVAPLYKDYSLKFWQLSLSGNAENEKALVAAKEKYLKVYNNREEFEKLRSWKVSGLQMDTIEARELKLIHDSFVPNQIEESVLREIVERETQIENLFNTFRADFEGAKASDNQLRDILRNETDISRRRAAWEASKQVGQEVASQLLELIRIRNREAQKLGYQDYYSMMFELQELDEKWVFSLFNRLEQLSDKAFTEMKTELDSTLKKKYRINDPQNSPWLYSDPFFQEFPTAGATESLDDVFKNSNIEDLTKAHYNSIGLEIDDLLNKADLYEREGKSQHDYVARIAGLSAACVVVHQAGEKILIQRSPVDTNPNRLLVFQSDFDDRSEIVVVLAAHSNIAGIDSIFVERCCTIWILAQQNVPVVMKIANNRRCNVPIPQTIYDFAYSSGSFARIDRNPDKF